MGLPEAQFYNLMSLGVLVQQVAKIGGGTMGGRNSQNHGDLGRE